MKRKVLFITHDTGIYGASRSLQTFLKEYEGAEIHFMVAKQIYHQYDFQQINGFFHNKIKSFHQFYLPIDLCFHGRSRYTFRSIVYKILYFLNRFQIYSFLKSQNFDFIHLNSLVLHPLLKTSFPFVIHVREIYNGTNEKVKPNLQKAKGVIFIDESTKDPFRNLALNQSLVLNNPIDMRDVCLATKAEATLDNLTLGKTVFSIIGGIDANKGVDFIIETFKQIASPNALLLIVGNGLENFINHCKEIAGDDKRIIFYGEEPEIKKIYQVSDYILRGEPYFCIGRTTFEGLYAGCKVILPGHISDSSKFFEYEKFADSLIFYSPKSVTDLKEALEKCSDQKIITRECRSNLDYHITHFNDFIQKIGL